VFAGPNRKIDVVENLADAASDVHVTHFKEFVI
jgi:hypothetical protein